MTPTAPWRGFRGSTKIATDTATPYSVVWKAVPAGTHQLRARAFDDKGAVAYTPWITITIGRKS